jgi:hypothetical protein
LLACWHPCELLLYALWGCINGKVAGTVSIWSPPRALQLAIDIFFFSLVIIIRFIMFSVFVRIVGFLLMHNNCCFYTWYNTYLFLLNCQPPISMIT